MAFPPWSMGFALFLALASVIPIVAVAALRACGVSLIDVTAITMRRIETSASTRPMLSAVNVRTRQLFRFTWRK